MVNQALISRPFTTNITQTGSITLTYDTNTVQSAATSYPAEVMLVSVASAATITLPPIALTYPTTGSGLGAGRGQRIEIMNLAAVAVSVAAPANHTLIGSTATIAQNVAAEFIADSDNAQWIRLRG